MADGQGDSNTEEESLERESISAVEEFDENDLFDEGGYEGGYEDMPGMQTVSESEDEGEGDDDDDWFEEEGGDGDDLFEKKGEEDEGMYEDMPGMQTVSESEDDDDCADDDDEWDDVYDYKEPTRFDESEVAAESFAYKKVENRVKPVATTLPENFRIVRKTPRNPLQGMPELPTRPPEFTPGKRYTEERKQAMKVNEEGFLWPEEEKLVHYLLKAHEDGFAWDESEKGKFKTEYFEPVTIPTVEHVPWVLRNIPIPRGSYDQVIEVIKSKISSGIYEPSNSSYRSRWFTVLKKDGKSLRLVHDLQPLNRVSIKDSALPPSVEPYAESFGGRSCYGMFDLFVGFDQRELAVESRDLTTFQTPLGTFRLTSIPMGYTNSMQIQHGDTTFLLQDEIPHVTQPFIDDIPVKGPTTRYELPRGGYQTIPENDGIRRFVWEHLENVNRVIQRIRIAGGTFSGPKSSLCAASAVIVGHVCNYEGRIPLQSRVQKITDWPICKNVTDVRGFLGTLGTIRVFIKDYAKHAKPLVDLTRKDKEFTFGETELAAMGKLKLLAETCPAIRAINYDSDNEVTLAVDSSWMAVGYVLSQTGDDGVRYPSRFGSITWNEREQRYSQAKLELYGTFRALKDARLYIVGVKKLVVEVDAKYIKGMINNPDIVPNAAANRWLAGILLFSFELRHIPGKDHAAADGLSRRGRAEGDPTDEEDIDDWIDEANGFAVELLNWKQSHVQQTMENRDDLQDDPPYLPRDEVRVPRRPESQLLPPRALVLQAAVAISNIPRTEKARARDETLAEIRRFLANPSIRPREDMTDQEFTRFVRQASDYFLRDAVLWRKDKEGKHKLVIPANRRISIIQQAHDDLGHKGVFSVRMRLLERFWWPYLEDDVKWYTCTCHECQVRQLRKIQIPPTVPTPRGLFRKVYVDTMLMPKASGYRYIAHARCSLSSFPEWAKLKTESAKNLASFLFTAILCRWGAIEEIVTDNAPQYLAAAELLVEKYKVHHIRISPYNSRAQGPIERRHFDVREALVKASGGAESRWPEVAPSVFWAERVTVQKSTGYSPYYLAHGVEPLLPFDLAESTYLCPAGEERWSTTDLIAQRAVMLQKREEDLSIVRERVLSARWKAVKQKEEEHRRNTIDFDFKPGALVLVRNSVIDKDLGSKTKPRYLGPMLVVRRTAGGSYVLAELDGAISKLRYGAARLFPYFPRTMHAVPVTSIVEMTGSELEELDRVGSDDDSGTESSE